jgi:thymidine kinase
MVCGEQATRTQRLIDGEPARADSPLIVVDQSDAQVEYQARCLACYQPPV